MPDRQPHDGFVAALEAHVVPLQRIAGGGWAVGALPPRGEWPLLERVASSRRLELLPSDRARLDAVVGRLRRRAGWLGSWAPARGMATAEDLRRAASRLAPEVEGAVRSEPAGRARLPAGAGRAAPAEEPWWDAIGSARDEPSPPGFAFSEDDAADQADVTHGLTRQRALSLALAARGTRDWSEFIRCGGRDLEARKERVRLAVVAGDVLARSKNGGMDGHWFMGPMYVDNMAYCA